jgi:hypothetical protein
MRLAGPAIAVGVLLAAQGTASAFTIIPADEDPDRIIVVIDRDYGDVVPLRALPPPYGRIVQSIQGPDGLSFRWRYYRSSEEGMYYMHVRPGGSGSAHFEFYGPELAEGDVLGAAAVLVDGEGAPMHTFLARADVTAQGAFSGGGQFHHVRMDLDRPHEWWERVEAIAFFTMKYYSQQRPADDGVWQAMENAVQRLTVGQGGKQRSRGEQDGGSPLPAHSGHRP